MYQYFILILSLVCFNVNAQNFIDHKKWKVGVGSLSLMPDIDEQLSLDGAPLSGMSFEIDTVDKLVLFTSYRFSEELSISAMITTPIKATVELRTPISTIDAIDFEALPLALAIQYSPEVLRWNNLSPFIGVSPIYLLIQNEQLTDEFDYLANTSFGLTNGELAVDSEWSILWQTGVDYHINDNLSFRAVVMYFYGETSATASFDDGHQFIADIDYKVPVYALSLDYKI
ncbi:OmpW family outer membrane protein [Thalassotalea psychrophila]|uniref:OmpW family outer membrane protein n=1 Tax=Thalassotalea psychrophila TaxID=3065647 RepID=A0ABY9TZC9_9GAMM|nr:OmpW family outer membrane protein [Colwelliaceae bacterium SQ149]